MKIFNNMSYISSSSQNKIKTGLRIFLDYNLKKKQKIKFLKQLSL